MNGKWWTVTVLGAVLLGASLAIAVASGAFSGTETLEVGSTCKNPMYAHDGYLWESEDVFPSDWVAGRQVEGTFDRLDSESLVFTSLDETITFHFYILGEEGGFVAPNCRIA